MKRYFLASLGIACLLTLGCASDDPAANADVAPAADPVATSSVPPPADVAPTMQADMQQHMQKMQGTMAKIHESTSEEERQKLMEEHMAQMQDGMKKMGAMQHEGHGTMMSDEEKKMCAEHQPDSMMADGKMMCADSADGKTKDGTCGMCGSCGMCGMKTRMDMMEKMMGQMMEHQSAGQAK